MCTPARRARERRKPPRAHSQSSGAMTTPPSNFAASPTARLARGLADTIGIELIELTPTRVVATMPVDERTRQPFGILHGGASLALAETVASVGAVLNVDQATSTAVGVEINANHIRSKRSG